MTHSLRNMGKRRKFNTDDSVIKSLLAAMEDADKTERISGRSSSKTYKYSADNVQRRNRNRYRELNLIQNQFETILAPEHALMNAISADELIASRPIHRTHSARERRRQILFDFGDELMDRRSELENELLNDDDTFDEVTSRFRP